MQSRGDGTNWDTSTFCLQVDTVVLVKRLTDSETRLKSFLKAMKATKLAPIEQVKQLRQEVYEFTLDLNFKKANSMGEIIQAIINYMKRNFKHVD